MKKYRNRGQYLKKRLLSHGLIIFILFIKRGSDYLHDGEGIK